MKTKSTNPPIRRKFNGDWDQVLYCYYKVLYWFYARQNRRRASRFCETLERLLRKVDSKHESIRGEECRSLLYEARGQLDKAILHRRNEIRLLKRLQRFKPRFEHYGPDDLADRLELLGILYKDSNDIRKAIKAMTEAKRICAKHRIKFDSPDLLEEYKADEKKNRNRNPVSR
jgi:tetratricopeptide (TPR) repeat protein